MARTQAELDALFTDLPAPHPTTGHVTHPVTAGPAGYRRDWYSYIPESAVGRIAALIAVVVAVILVFPFAVAAVVLYFIVLPRLTCGRRWGYGGRPDVGLGRAFPTMAADEQFAQRGGRIVRAAHSYRQRRARSRHAGLG